MSLKIQQQEKKLDDLFKLVEAVTDDETKAVLSKFLCVRTSGFIETTIKNLINDYIDGTSPKKVQDFVNKKMRSVTNLRYDKILLVLDMFSSEWRDEFIAKTTDEEKSALNSIVSNRNNISHGEVDAISFVTMKLYYVQAKKIVENLKAIIKK